MHTFPSDPLCPTPHPSSAPPTNPTSITNNQPHRRPHQGKEYSDFLTTLCYDHILTVTNPASRM
jgi:hypothetical protein